MIVLHWLINHMINLIEELKVQQLEDCTKVLPSRKKDLEGNNYIHWERSICKIKFLKSSL